MAWLVHKPGLWSTVQDWGRRGWQRYGVTPGGPMDEWSFRLANVLAGNGDSAAALEMTLSGGVFEAAKDAVIAVCGADMSASIDGEPLPMWRPIAVKAGATIRFGTSAAGRYTYLAVAGGFDTPVVLGSRSAAVRNAFPDLTGRTLAIGDVLPVGFGPTAPRAAAAHWFLGDEWRSSVAGTVGGERIVRVLRGKEWPLFTEESRALVEGGDWVCTVRPESDRMGYRLSGTQMALETRIEMLSSAVTAGTMQVPPDGRPIVLMSDRGTTGGYPRMLQVITADVGVLAQMRPGERVRFWLVELDEAVDILMEREHSLQWLRDRLRWAN